MDWDNHTNNYGTSIGDFDVANYDYSAPPSPTGPETVAPTFDSSVYDFGYGDPTPPPEGQGWQQDERGNFYKIDNSGGLTFRDDKGTEYTYNTAKGGFTDSKGNLAGGDNPLVNILKRGGQKLLDLFKGADGKTDWTKLLTLAGGAYAASRPSSTTPTGYQGKIPKLTASRNMLTAPPVGRRPGSGGIDYGGGVTYRTPEGELIQSNERTLEELRQAAVSNPFNRGATFEGQQSLGQSDLASLLQLLNSSGGAAPAPASVPAPAISAPATQPSAAPSTSSPFVIGGGGTSTPIETGPLDAMNLPVGGRFSQAEKDAALAKQNAELEARKARRAAFAASGLPNQVVLSGYGPEGGAYNADTGAAMKPYIYADGKYTDPNAPTAPATPAAPSDNWMSNLSFDANAMPRNFDWQKYVATNTDLGAAGIDTAAEAMRHYQNYGIAEKRSLGLAAGGLTPNGFVVPADVVSHLGNGSSEAGLKLLVSKFDAEPIKGEGDGMSDSIPTTIGGKQEARVANDEAFISPEMVKRIGGGDAKKGAKKLYAMMDQIREERTGTKEQGKQIDPNKFMPGGSVQKYQTGGTTATRTLPASATGSESSLSNWAGDYVTNLLGQGAALANAPYQAYTGPLTAGASGLQQQGFTQAGNLQTPSSIGQAAGTAGGIANLAANMQYSPQTTSFLGQPNVSGLGMTPPAAGGTQGGSMGSPEPFAADGGMTGGVMSPPKPDYSTMPVPEGGLMARGAQPVGNMAQQYMNPYLQSALRPMMEEARREADIARVADAGRLTRAGAFGGSRQAIMESEGRRNLMEKQNQLLTSGYKTAYEKAMDQFNADQDRRAKEAQFGATFGLDSARTGIQGAQAQAQAGAQQSAADIAGLRALLDAGAVERGIESEGIAADKKQFEEARVNPFNMIQFQQSLLSGMPLASQSYSIPGQSGLQKFAGGASTLQELMDILSGKKSAATKT
jgi:hypothetical protein